MSIKKLREMFQGSDHFAILGKIEITAIWEYFGEGRQMEESREVSGELLGKVGYESW